MIDLENPYFGWINPAGDFLMVAPPAQEEFARAQCKLLGICDDFEFALMERGWTQITYNWTDHPHVYFGKDSGQPVIEALKNLAAQANKDKRYELSVFFEGAANCMKNCMIQHGDTEYGFFD
jgi:hypothetical protein